MSEKIEFIPASALPVAEGDEVSVLCLENGELKQKPASGLGGGGGSHWIMHLSTDYYNSALAVSDGLYEALEKMFASNTPVPVTIFMPNNDGSISIPNYSIRKYTMFSDGSGFGLTDTSSRWWNIRGDGNHNFYYDP